MPRCVETLMRRVLAHWANHDPVLHLHSTDLQRREQLGDRSAVRLRRLRRACWGLLGGAVVRKTRYAFVVDVLLVLLAHLVWACALLWGSICDVMVRVAPLSPD